jgi:hypothetical protein
LPGSYLVSGHDSIRALIQNRAFSQPVKLSPETISSSHAGLKPVVFNNQSFSAGS